MDKRAGLTRAAEIVRDEWNRLVRKDHNLARNMERLKPAEELTGLILEQINKEIGECQPEGQRIEGAAYDPSHIAAEIGDQTPRREPRPNQQDLENN